MKYAIISDIHSNIEALNEALNIIDDLGIKKIKCLGDVVGYNANPSECIQVIRERRIKTIMGNHDWMVSEGLSACADISTDALHGVAHSLKVLNDEEKDWLRELPRTFNIENAHCQFMLSHGNPSGDFEYILGSWMREDSFSLLRTKYMHLCFFGHTHLPAFFESDSKGRLSDQSKMADSLVDGEKFSVAGAFGHNRKSYYLLNPGSIGQPRGCPYSFMVLDTKDQTVEYKTFEYDVDSAQKAIRDAGYSDRIAERLVETGREV